MKSCPVQYGYPLEEETNSHPLANGNRIRGRTWTVPDSESVCEYLSSVLNILPYIGARELCEKIFEFSPSLNTVNGHI